MPVEKIVKRIEKDAEDKVKSIKEEKKKKAEEIRDEIDREKERKLDELEKEKEREIKTLKNRIISQAELEARKKKLKVREEMIEKVFDIVKKRLEKKEAAEYEDYLQNSIEKAHRLLEGDMTIYCNPEAEREVKGIAERIDPHLEVRPDLESIGGVKVVSEEGATIDMTFEANMERKKKELRKEISDILFPEEE